MSSIQKIQAREVLDSRGNPTVEVEVFTSKAMGRAIVPSGASTGIHEALELRDGDKNRFNGKGVTKAVYNVNRIINKHLKGISVFDQEKIDRMLIEFDGTPNKSRLGANSILGVSLGAARAGANEKGRELFAYWNEKARTLPVPMMNIVNGGKHADSGLDFQEFMILPVGAPTFKEALRMGAEIFHCLKSILEKYQFTIAVGDEGGFAPKLKSNEAAFDLILEAIKAAKYRTGKDVLLGIDVASSEFYAKGKGYKIKIKGKECLIDSNSLTNYYVELISKYPLILIEDSHSEDDFDGWQTITQKLGKKIQLVGDDFLVTNVERIKKALSLNCANALLVKLNQIGTVTETFEAIKLVAAHKWNSIISHRSGESEDTSIADLAVAMETGLIKTGSLSRTDRICKYNQLLRIEEKLQKKARYPGHDIFSHLKK